MSERAELVAAYDCRWCKPFVGTTPVTHYDDGLDDVYAEHWYARDRDSLRGVLMIYVDQPAPKRPPRPPMTKAKATKPPRRKKAA